MRKAKNGVYVRCIPGVPADVRRELRRVASLFPEVSRVRHRISVVVAPAPAISGPDGGVGFGAFLCPARKRYSGPLRIYIAGRPMGYKSAGVGRREAVHAVGESLLHELAHYEQYRDGRTVQERGVEVRAKSLYRLIDALREE